MKTTQQVEFDAVVDGMDMCITFDRTFTHGNSLEGADADGNRGRWEYSFEDLTTDVTDVYLYDSQTSVSLASLSADQQAKVQAAVDDYCEKNDPEDLSEPDFDDVDD